MDYVNFELNYSKNLWLGDYNKNLSPEAFDDKIEKEALDFYRPKLENVKVEKYEAL